MKGFLLGSVAFALLLGGAPARAADSSSPYYNPYPNTPPANAGSPYYDPYPNKAPTYVPAGGWNGFYVGAVFGGGWASANHTDTSGRTTGDFSQSGETIGITAGYNWQLSSVLLGLEGDVSWADVKGSTPANCATSCFTKLTWFDTVRGRVGYVMGDWMPYVTGGLAFSTVRSGIQSLDDPNTGLAVEGSNNRIGPTVGAGVEWLFTPSWSLKAEYLYSTFGSQTTYTNGAGVDLPVTVTERNVNLFRAGVNWHFNY